MKTCGFWMRARGVARLLVAAAALPGCVTPTADTAESGDVSGGLHPKAPPAEVPKAPLPAKLPPLLPLAEPAVTQSPREVRVIGDTELLLSYFSRLRRLQGADLTREQEAARAAWMRATTDYNRVAYAMVLTQPGTAAMDEGRALELLEPLVKRGDDNLRGLAFMLSAFIQEQRRVRWELGATQQKLDALKSLERNLIERDQTNPGRK